MQRVERVLGNHLSVVDGLKRYLRFVLRFLGVLLTLLELLVNKSKDSVQPLPVILGVCNLSLHLLTELLQCDAMCRDLSLVLF